MQAPSAIRQDVTAKQLLSKNMQAARDTACRGLIIDVDRNRGTDRRFFEPQANPYKGQGTNLAPQVQIPPRHDDSVRAFIAPGSLVHSPGSEDQRGGDDRAIREMAATRLFKAR